MNLGDRAESALNILVTLGVLVVAGATVHREFLGDEVPTLGRKSEYVRNWPRMLDAAQIVGDTAAPVTLVEFTDFQCPFCRRFQQTIESVRAQYPTQVAVAIVHLPLAMHPDAVGAAQTVECAARGGRLVEAANFVFEHQDSLGKAPWTWYAAGSGVTDIAMFNKCLSDPRLTSRVDRGRALADSLGYRGTPTVLLNGWRFGSPPSDTELVRAIGDVLNHKKPYKGFPSEALAGRSR